MANKTKSLVSLAGKTIEKTPINSLKPNPLNPLNYTDAKLEKIAGYIKCYGINHIILVDGHDNIITGYAWWRGAQIVGLKHVPTVLVDHLSEADIAILILADQKLAEVNEWDDNNTNALLQLIIDYKFENDIELDLSVTGFEVADIDNRIFATNEETEDVTTETILNQAEQLPAVTKSGDIWMLGSHKVLCGDSLDPESYQKLLGNKAADILCSDPPYNVPIDGFVSGNGAVKHREFKNASGEMTSGQFTDFLHGALQQGIHATREGSVFYVFMDWRHATELLEASKKLNLKQLNLCVWDKGCGGMGSFYRSQHELVFVFRHGKVAHRNNIMLGKYGRNRTNVWQYPSANMSSEGREALKHHPTPKPIAMIMDIIKDVTKPGDIVLDPFLGSGTTVLAAEKTGRSAYAIDIDPLYIDVTIRRWQALTGMDVSPELHISVKRAKDIAAGAVLICAIGAALIGILIFWSYLLHL